MTVESTDRKQTFSGGQATNDFTFRALTTAPTDIKVKKTLIATGVDTDLTYTTDYTVAVDADGVGGTVTYVTTVSTAYTTTVYRETTDKQESDYDDYNQFPADTLETDLDRRTMISQEAAENIDRTLKLSITSTVTASTITVPSPVADNLLGWNSTADNLENFDVADLGAIVVDTDVTLAANSDDRVASQKAIKAFVESSTSSTVGVRSVFYNSTVTSGTMVITYSTVAFPYTKTVTIVNSNGTVVIPDTIAFAASSATITMTSYLPISGTWGTLVI